jgi:3-methyladenine DNA glycosylase/8-oxoguanine DNA glycosylase
MKRGLMIPALIAAGGLLFGAVATAQTALKSPQSVKTGLRILNQVVGHTGRLIDAKSYDIVPREQQEFDAGAALLREAIAGEPAAFKAKIDPLIEASVKASSAMGEAAKAHDDAKLAATHDKFAAAVKSVIEQFPEDLRPKPGGMMGPGGPPAGAPPPRT